MHKIEKDIPVSKVTYTRKTGIPATMRKMEVGDSFFIETDNPYGKMSNVNQAKKRIGGEFVTRTVDGGLRVWRVA